MVSLAQLIRGFDPDSDSLPAPGWLQGRTVYGGLSAALALQSAIGDARIALPPLKSAQVSFIGPVAGPMRFETEVLRQGSSATTVAVDCISGPGVALRATFLFANPRPSRVRHDFSASPPRVGHPDDCRRIGHDGAWPAFLGNFDLRLAGGSLPVSGAANPEFVAWVRHGDAVGVDPAVALVAIADSLPPAVLACLTEMAPVSSMTWAFDLPQPAAVGEWFLLRSASLRAGDGYSHQAMDIWDERGSLVLTGSQTIALFA